MFRKWLGCIVCFACFTAPAFAVESIYLDAVPVTNPGEYLAPPDFYMQVPPPTAQINAADQVIPAYMYNSSLLQSGDAEALTATSYVGNNLKLPTEEEEQRAGKLKVYVVAGEQHASDTPLSVIKNHIEEIDEVELAGADELYDVKVQVETMRLEASSIVFVIVNAYKYIDDEPLIFYNNFGYVGEQRLEPGSESYATQLGFALIREADGLPNELE